MTVSSIVIYICDMTITLPRKLHEGLYDDSRWLYFLFAEGVQNWDGYARATKRFDEDKQLRQQASDSQRTRESAKMVRMMREAGFDDDALRAAGMLP